MTLQIGTRLGHYRILALLGRGGMADVYRAEDERLGREVALKAVPPEFARDLERVERFRREVRAAARLTHPNIVTVYEFGQGEELHFYTMELMTGGDLKARIRTHPEGMTAQEVRTVALAMAKALDYAHQRGFVHRDVKPENVLFGEDGTPQLTDFGIARSLAEGTRMTATGMSIGSPHYMSPEQARGLLVDGRSDLYSLGVVLYEMLTGRLPFNAADSFGVAYSHINDPVPELPRKLAAWQPVLERLTAKAPHERYGSAGELGDVLAAEALLHAPEHMPARVFRPVPEAGGIQFESEQKQPDGTSFTRSQPPRANQTVVRATNQGGAAGSLFARFGGYPRGLAWLLFSFKGRVGRLMFLQCFGVGLLATWIFHVALYGVSGLRGFAILSSFYWLLAIWPWIAVVSKRLHDLGRSALAYCVYSVLANLLVIFECLAVENHGWLEIEFWTPIGLVGRLFSIPMLYAIYLGAIKRGDVNDNDFGDRNPRRGIVFRF